MAKEGENDEWMDFATFSFQRNIPEDFKISENQFG